MSRRKEHASKASKPATSSAARSKAPAKLSAAPLFPDFLEQVKLEPQVAQFLKRTFYLTPEDIELLEFEKARRRRVHGRSQGVADLSLLVREAIRRAYGNAASTPDGQKKRASPRSQKLASHEPGTPSG